MFVTLKEGALILLCVLVYAVRHSETNVTLNQHLQQFSPAAKMKYQTFKHCKVVQKIFLFCIRVLVVRDYHPNLCA